MCEKTREERIQGLLLGNSHKHPVLRRHYACLSMVRFEHADPTEMDLAEDASQKEAQCG